MACKKKLACVLCTTGLGPKEEQLMQQAALTIPVFHSANMSLGINLLAQLARRAAAALPGFDIEIIEKHHNKKLDAPSGTALLLADAINRQAGGTYEYVYNRQPLRQARGGKEIGIHAVRGGTIVGDHDLLFAGPDEVITLSHSAQSRNVFANGAIAAALYVAKKPAGLYSMQDLMEEL
ncbi:MAG: 4-hydroxy-tetrahydrodipicolinate reductase [Oscillospiraceae bacterium]